MPGSPLTKRFISHLFLLLIISSLVASCSLNFPWNSGTIATPGPSLPTSPPPSTPQAEVTFITHIPADTPAGQGISLDILDELTGLAINSKQNLMTPISTGVYSVKVILPVGSLLKYRYSRTGSPPSIEFTSTGYQVRYRLFSVTGPAQVEDEVSAWTDLRYSGSTGRIQGDVINSANNLPIPGLLVEAGGIHALTSSEGSFLLEGLPPGKHTLFVYSLDGSFLPFQQEAVVAADSTTPARISLAASRLIKVTFVVSIPPSTLNPLPVRLIGNLYSLGDTFADLRGGFSTVANRAPLLTPRPDGTYSLTLNLPAGMFLQYKYSLGDGFWNAEHTTDGRFRLREVVLPAEDLTIVDVVDSWSAPNSESVTFSLTVPPNTPATDSISIQFNPFGWTEPIPMWALGNNQWIYTLYSPLHLLGNVGYRYCRNDACGAADDAATAGPDAKGWPISSSLIHQDFQDTVEKWAWWQPTGQPTTIVATEVHPKGSGFITGIKLQAPYQPAWLASFGTGFQNIKDLGANWAFVSPTFRYIRSSPPVLESVPGKDMLWQDARTAVALGQGHGLLVGIHPQTIIEGDAGLWWNSTTHDDGWWANWFARYRTFAIHNADLAASTNAGALILGDANTLPAYPGGLLPDGNPSNVPGNAAQFWGDLITEIRQHYHGLLFWHIPSPAGLSNLPTFLSEVDAITVSLDDPLSNSTTPTQSDLMNAIGATLDNSIRPIQDQFGKPLVLELRFASANGSAQGCIPHGDQCISVQSLDQPAADYPTITLDLDEQLDLYSAALQAVNDRPWINGVISGGYFAPTVLMDKSSSIHGKPASDALWYWYHEFLK